MSTTESPDTPDQKEKIFFESPDGELYEVELELADFQYLAAEAKSLGVTFEEHLLDLLKKMFFPTPGETGGSGA